jgi:hypothetical protein
MSALLLMTRATVWALMACLGILLIGWLIAMSGRCIGCDRWVWPWQIVERPDDWGDCPYVLCRRCRDKARKEDGRIEEAPWR